MPSASVTLRATIVLLVATGVLAACNSRTPPKVQAPPGAPTVRAVIHGRYASSVDLDHGDLLVTPPATRATPAVSESEADALFEATDAVQGPHPFAILGLGVVTLAPRAERGAPPTTTTTTAPPPTTTTTVPSTTVPPSRPPPPTTTVPPSTVPPTTAPTTVPATTATMPTHTAAAARSPRVPVILDADDSPTGASTTTETPSTTAPALTPSAPAEPALPSYHRRLAWVGIVWGPTSCPGSSSSTTTSPTAATGTAYTAVLIDARTGHQVLAYTSGGPSPCGTTSRAPAVSEPNELVSVPWQPVGPASTGVLIQVPPCGHYYGWTQMPTTGTGIADQVVVSVPFDPSCATTTSLSQTIDQVVPLGPGQGLVGHAALGPIRALQTLPTS